MACRTDHLSTGPNRFNKAIDLCLDSLRGRPVQSISRALLPHRKSSISHIPSVRHITDALITRSETNLDGSACNRSYRRAWLDSNKEISEVILNCNKQSGVVRSIEKTNIFSNVFQNEQEECKNDIKDKVYYVFKKSLPRSLVQTIRNHLAFNYLHPEYRGPIDKSRFIDRADAISDNNKTIRFFYDSSKINTSAPLQYLAHDYALLVIIKELLGINPLVLIEGWLSVGKQDTELIDRSMAAQMFHFDLDAPNFLKLFIYLSDVTLTLVLTNSSQSHINL